MMKKLVAAAALAVTAPMLVSAACPAGVTGDTYFNGARVAFRFNESAPTPFITAIGTFVGLPGGLLNVTLSRMELRAAGNSSVTRMAPGSGRWMVAPDCNSGMLWINFDSKNYTLNIAISATGAITVAPTVPVNGTTNPPPNGPTPRNTGLQAYDEAGRAVVAVFSLNPPNACPAGTGNPLNILNGMTYAFTGIGNDFQGNTPSTDSGTFTGSFQGGYSGNLIINNRMIFFPGVAQAPGTTTRPLDTNTIVYMPRDAGYGRYIIYPDCSGGELLFNDAFNPRQYEFIFANSTFTTIWYIADAEVRTAAGLALYPFNGVAIKQ